jgi:hypothetical protein
MPLSHVLLPPVTLPLPTSLIPLSPTLPTPLLPLFPTPLSPLH